MPVKIPVRAEYNNSGSPTGLSEYQTNEFVGSLYGGTGYNTYSNGEILIGNSSGTLTKNTIQGEAGKITVTNNDGAIIISLDADIGISPATTSTVGTVKVPSTDAVAQLNPSVTTAGTGYVNATNVMTRGSNGSGLTLNITTSNGAVTAAVIVNGGTRYKVSDVVTITGAVTSISDTTPTPSAAWQASQSYTGVLQTSTSGTGTSATFDIVTDSSGNPTVSINSGGSGYISADTIVFSDPSGLVTGLSDTTPTPTAAWQISQLHGNISPTSTSGSGTDITFDILTDSDGNPTFSILKGGKGFKINDTILVTDPGDTTNTATVTVLSARDSYISGAWKPSQSHTGLAQTSTSGSGTSATFDATTDANGDPTVTIDEVGSGYAVADTVVITEPSDILTLAAIPIPSGLWQGSQSHTAVPQTSTSGDGTGATFDITTDGAGNLTAVTINAGGTGYVYADTLILTDPGSSDNTVTVTVASATVPDTATLTVSAVSSGGITYISDTTPTVFSTATITGANTDAQVTVQNIVKGGLTVDGYGNISHSIISASSGNEFTTLANLEVLKKLEVDSFGHVTAAQKEMLYIGNGIQLVEEEGGTNKLLQSDGQDIAMAIALG